ncbi:cytochrome P450 [Micromonospora sp. NPDC049044]|uniref:cytochrome P450 n=1 Tax=unclassified Micromonospora TaxID=2617518 RepID=UPI0033E6AA1F
MTEAQVKVSFPMERKCPFQPPAEYAELRESEPIALVDRAAGGTTWVATKHEYVRKLLADPRVSSDRSRPNNPSLVPIPPQFLQPINRPLVILDPPEHTRHRRLIINEFTMKRVQNLRPNIQRIVDTCIDDILAGENPTDLVENLARPVPTLVICELLGISYEERKIFWDASSRVFRETSTPQEIGAAFQELRGFLDAQIAAKEANPGDDLLSRLVVRYQEEGIYERARIISTALGLLVAGHETTANMIGLGAAALLSHPDQLAEFRADPALAAQTVEELLRYCSITDVITARTVTEDIEIGGVTLQAGDGVVALGGAANRDPEVFPEPDTFDIHRTSRQHVAFGYGPHQCLGANLARVELEIVYTTLFKRIPTLRLTVPLEELPFKNLAPVYGLRSLPAAW